MECPSQVNIKAYIPHIIQRSLSPNCQLFYGLSCPNGKLRASAYAKRYHYFKF